jgi:hypothetical protein
MITGAAASIVYGEPRLTNDLDLVLRLSADQAVWVAPVEYVILRKLEYYREGRSDKHLRDIAGILELSAIQIDNAWLEEQISERRLQDEWNAVLLTVSKLN